MSGRAAHGAALLAAVSVALGPRPGWAMPPDPSPAVRASCGPAIRSTAAGAAQVLLLFEVMAQLPVVQAGRESFERALSARSTRSVALFDESLDIDRFARPEQQRRLLRVIAEKYCDVPVDVIVVTGRRSLAAARTLRAALLPREGIDSIPIVYHFDDPGRPTAAPDFPRGPGITGVVWASAEAETGRRMRDLIPGLREVAVVATTVTQVALVTLELRRGLGETVRVTPLVGPTPAAFRAAAARLERPAAVFLHRVTGDVDGTSWLPIDYLRAIAPEGSVPIFSLFPTFLGEGIVGGAMQDLVRLGAITGALVADVLNGVPVDTMTPREEVATSDAYDWRAVLRHGIAPGAIPAGARVIGKPVPVWRQYPRVSATVTTLLLSLAGAVALLWRGRRRLAQSDTERRQLAQHLLTVQEAERQRIARDLHDDVCQEMSAIAVQLDVRERAAAPLADRLRALVERTRQVAHGLHAEPFGYAPLGVVLQQEAEALYDRHRIACTVRGDRTAPLLPPPVAAGAYRIAMEALQNVVAHASASACEIEVVQRADVLELSIADDGIGFVGTPRGGLGIVSMRERALALGGTLHIASEPFRGTRVTLTLPLPAAAVGTA